LEFRLLQNLEDSSIALFLGRELFNVEVKPDGIVPASKRSHAVIWVGKKDLKLFVGRESVLILAMVN
jgi:hypothetical protein